MMPQEALARAKAERANFVHVTVRGEEETDALVQYVQDRVNRQVQRGPEVLWYEVVLQGKTRRLRHQCSARVTAHLRDKDVFVAQTNPDSFLAARDAFDVLARRLRRVRGVRKSRAHASPGHFWRREITIPHLAPIDHDPKNRCVHAHPTIVKEKS